MSDKATTPQDVLLQASGITKTFSSVVALDGVDFQLRAGEVMALMGENGAGKSTLIKIITGHYFKDGGTIRLEGREIAPKTVLESQKLGIQCVYQELNLSPFLSVAENIFLGRELRNKRGLIDWKATHREARRLLEEMNIHLDVRRPLKELTAALQQMVAIARAVSVQARVLILDEPSSSLDNDEVQVLFEQIRRLKAMGMGVIYISHRMNEIFEISDRITVLRNGALVGLYEAEELDMTGLVTAMIGNELSRMQHDRKPDNPALKSAPELVTLRGIHKKNRLHDVNLSIKKGEIVGLAGLLGSGRTELARILFGDDQSFTGELTMDGQPVQLRSPAQAIRRGVAYCTEERRSEGIFALMELSDNIIMPSLPHYANVGMINEAKKQATVKEYIERLAIKTPSTTIPIHKLSGGNQQKALVARWLAMNSIRLIIFDEPTRGIDVGTKSEIEKLIQHLAAEGLSVLYISSEYEELVRGCDRIAVLYEGHLVRELSGEAISYENILDTIAAGSKMLHGAHTGEEGA